MLDWWCQAADPCSRSVSGLAAPLPPVLAPPPATSSMPRELPDPSPATATATRPAGGPRGTRLALLALSLAAQQIGRPAHGPADTHSQTVTVAPRTDEPPRRPPGQNFRSRTVF